MEFCDRALGALKEDVGAKVGDFVIRRADGVFAYHLVVVVDDALQGVTHVVRGGDLVASTGRQVFLQRVLGLPTPSYLHVPLVVDAQGAKLSKSAGAAAVIPPWNTQLCRALSLLGMAPPAEIRNAECQLILDWAVSAWKVPTVHGNAVLQESGEIS